MTTMLRRFQKHFLARALAPGVETSALTCPRGNGKTWLAAYILTRCLTPGDPLHVAGAEYLLCAASIEQARLCYRFVRADLEPTGQYRFIDSTTRIGIAHLPTNTRLRVLSSNGKTAMGIVGCPILVADEPGSWEAVGGTLMHDAIQTAQGKPGSPMKVIYIGTLAPAASGWWHDMIDDGTNGSTYVQALRGDPERWDQWPEIRRCNPLTAISADFRRKLLEERDAARRDTRLKARFMSYRLNIPSGDESTVLLTVDAFKAMLAREAPAPEGQPIVGVDLGGGRSWSAAVAMFPNGLIDAFALAPGVPDLEAQEKRDRVPPATYRRLFDDGVLSISEGLRVPPPALLWQEVRRRWGRPLVVVCDRFRLAELQDAVRGQVRIEDRVTRWSEASFDIRALRKGAKDGPFSVHGVASGLLGASLSVATVKNDDQGNTRLVKRGTNNTARDDVAAALLLAAGAWERKPTKPTVRSLGLAG